jgi:hypothetical protein
MIASASFLVWALLGALGLFLASTAVLLLVILVVAGVVEFVEAWRR